MTNTKCECKNCKCINKKAAVIILVIGLLIGGGMVFLMNNMGVGVISAEEAGEKVLNTINQHMLAPGMTASLVGTVVERGLHRVTVNIQEQEISLYLTKDGALLFPEAIDLGALLAVPAPTPAPVEEEFQLEFTQEELRQLAKRLTEEGVIFFSKGWCLFCLDQLQMFGEAVKYLPYVECCAGHGATEEELALCKEKNVGTVPDWRFPGKEPILGMLSIERLIELSGCELLQGRIR